MLNLLCIIRNKCMEFTLVMDHVVNSGLEQHGPSFGVDLYVPQSGIDNIGYGLIIMSSLSYNATFDLKS